MPSNPLPQIERFISRYVALPNPECGPVLALWVLHTWMFIGETEGSLGLPRSAPHTTPYVYVYSAEKQSGKTRLIEVLERLVHNPMRATDISNAVLFRSIGKLRPTMLIDEVDAVFAGASNEELRSTINGGYKMGGNTWRIVGDEPTQFPTFCPKLMAGIDNGQLPDTVQDRSIPIALRRKKKGQEVEPFYSFDVDKEASVIIESITAWVKDNVLTISKKRPTPIDGISDRSWEITMPLVAIAEAIGPKTAKSARKAITDLMSQREVGLTPGQQLLSDIRGVFTENKADKLLSREILEKLGDPWNGKLLGSKLRPYKVTAKVIRKGNEQGRGYLKTDFRDAWERYLD